MQERKKEKKLKGKVSVRGGKGVKKSRRNKEYKKFSRRRKEEKRQ